MSRTVRFTEVVGLEVLHFINEKPTSPAVEANGDDRRVRPIRSKVHERLVL